LKLGDLIADQFKLSGYVVSDVAAFFSLCFVRKPTAQTLKPPNIVPQALCGKGQSRYPFFPVFIHLFD